MYYSGRGRMDVPILYHPWENETCVWAAENGHLEVLKWARGNGCDGTKGYAQQQPAKVTLRS